MKKKIYCHEVDCEGAPGCQCLKPEAWEEWKFNKIHDKHELFELANDLLGELARNTIFITTKSHIHYDGERLMDELIAKARNILDREYDA